MLCTHDPSLDRGGRRGAEDHARPGHPHPDRAVLSGLPDRAGLGLHPAHGSGEELLTAQRDYFRRWGVIPADLFDGSPAAALTPATALFVHGSWVHLLGNMLFLHVFGPMTEARLGRVRFALCYAGCGYLALLGYAAANAGSERPRRGLGAISALLGAFLFLFPGGGSPVSCRSPSSCRCGCPRGRCCRSGRRCSGRRPGARRRAGPGWPIWRTWWASRWASAAHGCGAAGRLQ